MEWTGKEEQSEILLICCIIVNVRLQDHTMLEPGHVVQPTDYTAVNPNSKEIKGHSLKMQVVLAIGASKMEAVPPYQFQLVVDR